jgi:putative transposon-encoded protein
MDIHNRQEKIRFMIDIDSATAKKLVLKANYDSIYTEKVRSNGGNSAKINCKKEFIDNEVVVFVLKGEKEKGVKKEEKYER